MSRLGLTNFHSIVTGEGDPVFVFLHGFTLSHEMWKAQVDNFSLNATTIAVDLPGHGLSTIQTPPDIHEVAIKLRNHVKSIVQDRPIILCGLSLGGYIALEYARCFSEDIQAMILSNTEARSDTTAEKEKRDKMIAAINDGNAPDIIGQVSEILLSKVTQSENPDLKLILRDQMDLCPDDTLIFGFQMMRNRPNYLNEFNNFHKPVLLIAGDDDEICNLDDVKATQKIFSKGQLEIIENTGHLTPVENPIEFNRTVHNFIQSALGDAD
jgi:3-oxoadipate enol-lactonase